MNKEQKIKKLFENANKAISESRWSDAHTLWETINKKIPDNFGIIMNLAACKNNTGLNAEARELYFKAEKLSPLNIDVNYAKFKNISCFNVEARPPKCPVFL